MKKWMWLTLSLLLVSSLVLTGCGRELTAEEIVAKMQETIEATEDAHAVVHVRVNAQGIEMEATAEVWEKAPRMFRAEVLQASEPKLVGTTMVSDGQQAWLYDPSLNRVMVGAPEEIETPLPQEMLGSMQEAIQEILDASDVKLEGSESVAGRDAYKLTLAPIKDADKQIFPGDGTSTFWVDKESWIVLKAVYEAGAFGQGEMEIESFEMNPGLAESQFHFEIPAGAEVVDAQSQQAQPLTLDEAIAQAEFSLLVPAYVPKGATLIEIFRVGDTFVLRYNHSSQASFTITQGADIESRLPLGVSQNIAVRGQKATAISDDAGGNSFLTWTEDGLTVTVAGHIALEDALEVAESLQ